MSRGDYRLDNEDFDTSAEWECMRCGYFHEGKEPPRKCPECGAGANQFELVELFDDDWDDDDYDDNDDQF